MAMKLFCDTFGHLQDVIPKLCKAWDFETCAQLEKALLSCRAGTLRSSTAAGDAHHAAAKLFDPEMSMMHWGALVRIYTQLLEHMEFWLDVKVLPMHVGPFSTSCTV